MTNKERYQTLIQYHNLIIFLQLLGSSSFVLPPRSWLKSCLRGHKFFSFDKIPLMIHQPKKGLSLIQLRWSLKIRGRNRLGRIGLWVTLIWPGFLIRSKYWTQIHLNRRSDRVKSGRWSNFLIQWVIQLELDPCITQSQSMKYGSDSDLNHIRVNIELS